MKALHPRRFGLAGCAIGLTVFMIATSASGQEGLLRIGIDMPDTDEFYRDLTAGHRSYVELNSVHFVISMVNESSVPVAVDQARLRQVITARVATSADVPVSLRWLRFQAFTPDTPLPRSENGTAVIEAREAATWTVSITRDDGLPFTWGEYLVLLNVGSLRNAVSTPDGGTWGGRVMEGGAYKRLVSIKPPATSAETGRRWGIAAGAARQRGDNEAALDAMARAADADPSLRDNLAPLYLATGRYKEAIASYERIAARDGLRDLTAKFLAQAYIGVGENGKAMQALEKGRVPPEEVANEFARMRQRVSDRELELRQR